MPLKLENGAVCLAKCGLYVLGVERLEQHVIHPKKQSALSDISGRNSGQAALSDLSFGKRMKERLGTRDMAWLSRQTGISTSTLSDIGRGKTPRADNAVKIARALDTSVEQLLSGIAALRSPALVAADDAGWVDVAEYDISQITDNARGPVVTETPFRRDWLAQRFGNIAGLWLTRMPQRFMPFGLDEGDLIFVRDVAKGEHNQGAAYLLRRDGMLSAAILDAHADRVSEERIPFRHFGYDDGQAVPVARILGAPLVRF